MPKPPKVPKAPRPLRYLRHHDDGLKRLGLSVADVTPGLRAFYGAPEDAGGRERFEADAMLPFVDEDADRPQPAQEEGAQ